MWTNIVYIDSNKSYIYVFYVILFYTKVVFLFTVEQSKLLNYSNLLKYVYFYNEFHKHFIVHLYFMRSIWFMKYLKYYKNERR